MLTVKSFIFNPVEENTYILYNEQKQCCIIDPGCYFQQERDELKRAIETAGLTPVLLLNTHCHLDHVFGNTFVSETWHLPLHIHTKEKAVLDAALDAGKRWQLPFENYSGELVYIEENTVIHIGADALEIRFTPGHSPGSVSFYHEAGGFVISGDVLLMEALGVPTCPAAT
jgi:glyoxylase-like metal-dependent hydrolase (beta-lactamase superfamily II)